MLVVKGAVALRRRSFLSTLVTVHLAPPQGPPPLPRTSPGWAREGVSTHRQIPAFSIDPTNLAVNSVSFLAGESFASGVQYSTGTKALMPLPLHDQHGPVVCTLPAEATRRTLSTQSGEIVSMRSITRRVCASRGWNRHRGVIQRPREPPSR